MEWGIIIGASALIGVLVAWKAPRFPRTLAAALPWFGMLAYLLAYEYLAPYEDGGGASMWPVAQLVAGTVAALVGLASCVLARRVLVARRG